MIPGFHLGSWVPLWCLGSILVPGFHLDLWFLGTIPGHGSLWFRCVQGDCDHAVTLGLGYGNVSCI